MRSGLEAETRSAKHLLLIPERILHRPVVFIGTRPSVFRLRMEQAARRMFDTADPHTPADTMGADAFCPKDLSQIKVSCAAMRHKRGVDTSRLKGGTAMVRHDLREGAPPQGLSRRWRWTLRLSVLALGGTMVALVNPPASAVPAFTDQTGQPCAACHVGGFGPQLTPFGREFKLGGYTMRTKASMPLATMVQASFTHTAADNSGPPRYFSPNDNFALDQASMFLAGGVGHHLGGFVQATYDGVGHHFHWDNTDIRLVNTGRLLGTDATYGLSFNNAPMVQDAWNTTPAWSFPYTSSALASSPSATPLLDGALAQNVVGLTAYGWFNHHLYVEAGGYSTPAAGTLNWLGADPMGGPGNIRGLAPYGRIAWQTKLAGGTAEAGAFALKATFDPGRQIASNGYGDRYTDVGLDASWIKSLASSNTVSANFRYIHEASNLEASCVLAAIGDGSNPECAATDLNEWRGDVSYYWHNKIGASLGAFATSGTSNSLLYAPTNRPDSNGLTAQIDYTPWGNGNSPMGPLANLRVGIQYTAYGRFNGAVNNYDGNGANAADADTLRVFTWLAF